MIDLQPGTVLGDRFEVHGVIGRGGTATVVLATDRLRGESVALKIVHAHLAADPATRRRLQREVQTASVLRSSAALVPYDLHDLGGSLALSMPFHPGQSLAERVAASGPLPVEDVRTIGVRIATALADAHRVGLLHRDVTATNVLVGDRPGAPGADAVLTDFGLARLQAGTRSTGLLGTAGYAAPEVYAGDRADPRSDLYGLGAVLYLAVTGRPAFDPNQPAVALKRQLDGAVRPVLALRPDCPPDLAATIERLLAPDPGDRPQGAAEVIDALTARRGPEPAARAAEGRSTGDKATSGPPARGVSAAELLPGSYGVLVRERSEDGHRRRRRRRERAGLAPTAEDELVRWGRHVADRVRGALGVPPPAGRSPEEALAEAVGRVAGLPEGALAAAPALDEREFWLVEGTDRDTAHRLAATARTLGFHARAHEITAGEDPARWAWALYVVGTVLGWVLLRLLVARIGPAAFAAVLAFTILGPMVIPRMRRGRSLGSHPVAYTADLRSALAAGFALEAAPRVATPALSRGGALQERALRAIEGLEGAIGEAELPDVARADLRSTAAELRRNAGVLAAEIDRLEAALAERPVDEAALAALQARLDRLATLAAAGVRSEAAERERLQRAVDEARAAQDAADELESRLAAATARLVEIAGAAARTRRDLTLEAAPAQSADVLVERLRAESRAATEARREAQLRAGRRGRVGE